MLALLGQLQAAQSTREQAFMLQIHLLIIVALFPPLQHQ